MKSLLAVLGIGVVMATAAPSGAATPQQICEGAKAQATGKAVAGLLKCASTASKRGTAVDAACEAKVRDKMDLSFEKAEAKGGCDGTEDAGTATLRVGAFTLGVRGDLSLGLSKCTAAKYLTAGKLSKSLAKCRKKARLDGQPLDAACVTEATAKFACTAAEERGDCLAPAGNCPALESKVVGFVTCGDGNPDAGEQCDDGNLAGGDGCDDRCQTETHAEASVGDGGSVTTDQGGGATPAAPAQATVMTPAAGTVSITVGATNVVQSGYRLLDRQFEITAPPGTMSAPLVLTFTFDASLVAPGVDENTLVLFRNGVPISECPGDPCVSTRQHVGDDFVLTVTTTEASTYAAGSCSGGSETCTCAAGWTGADCQTDIDECNDYDRQELCGFPLVGHCLNELGSYTCDCDPGYFLRTISSNPRLVTCQDIPECLSSPCGSSPNQCIDLVGAYQCNCATGYTHTSTIDGEKCTDINECLTNHGDCPLTRACSNTAGGHDCTRSCSVGSEPSLTGEGCTGINGCHINNGGCVNAKGCLDAGYGGVGCDCELRFWGTNGTRGVETGNVFRTPPAPCTDTDECTYGIYGTGQPACHPLASCTNTVGFWKCACPPDHSGTGYDSCVPANPDACGAGNKCIFVTSSVMTGNLSDGFNNGLDGADARCTALAAAAGLPGSYVAWLSTGAANAIDRVTSNGPYATPAGDLVANDLADLTDLSLSSPIDDDENGDPVDGSGQGIWVWTNTDWYGARIDFTPCSNWTSDDQFDTNTGWVGYKDAADQNWTHVQQTKPCNYPLHLYCIQQ